MSVLYGLADQPVSDAVAEGHRAAVSAALHYVEDRALGVRRVNGPERTVERLDGAFGATFLHRTSRALDPHLHSHVVLANLGRGPEVASAPWTAEAYTRMPVRSGRSTTCNSAKS